MDPPLHGCHYIVSKLSGPEKVSQFVEGSTKSSGTYRTVEAQHRFYPLLYSSMVLLQTIIKKPVCPVLYCSSQYLPYGFGIGYFAISCNRFRLVTNRFHRF